MRDSKDPDGPVLVFRSSEWRVFHDGGWGANCRPGGGVT